MNPILRSLAALILSLCLLPASGTALAEPLVVFCGFANQAAAARIAAAFEKESGRKVELIFGTGGRLLAQIKLSRRGDVFWPGSEDFIAFARRDGLLSGREHRAVAYHIPALLVPPGNPAGVAGLDDLARPGLKVVIPNPEATASGRAAIELLERNGLLEAVMGNVAAFAATPPQAARFAASGHADAVITWDIHRKDLRGLVGEVPVAPERIPRLIVVPAAELASTRDPAATVEFLDFLSSPAARAILAETGFLTRDDAPRFPNAEIGGLYEMPALDY